MLEAFRYDLELWLDGKKVFVSVCLMSGELLEDDGGEASFDDEEEVACKIGSPPIAPR